MTKQEKIREGMARRLFDSEMNRAQVFGVARREKAWADEKETYLARADDELHELHSQGVVIKVDRKLPDSAYSSLIFPTTIEEAGKFLTDKGLTDIEKSAVSGTIARLGWENCAKTMDEAGYVAVESIYEHH